MAVALWCIWFGVRTTYKELKTPSVYSRLRSKQPAAPIHPPGDWKAALKDAVPMGVWTQPTIASLFNVLDRTQQKLHDWHEPHRGEYDKCHSQ